MLQREHDWLLPKVTEARAQLEADNKQGFKTEEIYIGWDDLTIRSKQVDTHLANIRGAAEYLADIADTLKMVLAIEEVSP